MRPRTCSPSVTTRQPIFFTRSQSAALLIVAPGVIVVTSVPFCLRMLSTDIAYLLNGLQFTGPEVRRHLPPAPNSDQQEPERERRIFFPTIVSRRRLGLA